MRIMKVGGIHHYSSIRNVKE